jgi:predicted GNAT family acetyltransferase
MDVDVRDVPERQRYEASIAGKRVGFAAYRPDGPVTVFTHTEVDPSCEGQGVASELIRHALDDVRRRGVTAIRPKCKFVAGYLDKHPEYAELRE